jgi:hypothetical protein
MRNFIACTHRRQKGQVKEDKTGKACSTYRGDAERIEGFGKKARRKETTRET